MSFHVAMFFLFLFILYRHFICWEQGRASEHDLTTSAWPEASQALCTHLRQPTHYLGLEELNVADFTACLKPQIK